MEENKNTEVEVMTEDVRSAASECGLEVTNLESSTGPSKSFMIKVVGGIAAVAIGAAVVIKRHKKKKAAANVQEEDFDEECDDFADYDEDPVVTKNVEKEFEENLKKNG